MVKKVNIIITISCVLLLTFFIMFVVGLFLEKSNEGNIIYTIANISTNTSEQYYSFKVDGEYNIYSLNISSNNRFTGLIYPNYGLYSENIDGKYVFSSVVDLDSNYSYIEITWNMQANNTLLLTIDTIIDYCDDVCNAGNLLVKIGLGTCGGILCLTILGAFIWLAVDSILKKKRLNKGIVELTPTEKEETNNKELNV